MVTLFNSARVSKPQTFAQGLELEPLRREVTQADRAWWAATSNRDCTDYMVLGEPRWMKFAIKRPPRKHHRLASGAAACVDLMGRGLPIL